MGGAPGADLVEAVVGLDPAHSAGLGAHDDRVRAGVAARHVADAVDQVAVGDARGDEQGLVGADQVVGVEDLVDIEAGLGGAAALLVQPLRLPVQGAEIHRLHGLLGHGLGAAVADDGEAGEIEVIEDLLELQQLSE